MSNYSSDTLEDTYPIASMIASACNAVNVDQVKDLLKHGVELTERARKGAQFARISGKMRDAADKLDDAAEQLNRSLKRGEELATDVSAACQIAKAIDVLNDWILPGSTVTTKEAAAAFDDLFGGAARFFSKLPPPFNKYGAIFAEICKTRFFTNMEEITQRGQATAGGTPMRDVLRSIDTNGRD